MKNELVERWERTGLLMELDEAHKNKCATSLQECADLLVGKKNAYMHAIDDAIGTNGFFAGCILPVVRRLCLFLDDGGALLGVLDLFRHRRR